jgi:hypothetical protein
MDLWVNYLPFWLGRKAVFEGGIGPFCPSYADVRERRVDNLKVMCYFVGG